MARGVQPEDKWGVTTLSLVQKSATRAADPQAGRLNARFDGVASLDVLRAVASEFAGRIALLSSFGAEAAVPLHLLSQVAPATPVLFLETQRHFGQTAGYRDALVRRLGLTDLRILTPDAAAAEALDARGDLWRSDPDACCGLRKVDPLAAALPEFDLLITGRKRHHGADRVALPLFETIDGLLRLNLLAEWSEADVADHLARHDLPRHPLVEQGFASIGCWPCTRPSEAGRTGRWAGQAKTECGIHLSSRLRPSPPI